MKWYWFRFKRRALPLTVHLDDRDCELAWRGIYGVQIGYWFIGVVNGGVPR